jgi:hypothetical protein
MIGFFHSIHFWFARPQSASVAAVAELDRCAEMENSQPRLEDEPKPAIKSQLQNGYG